MTKEEIEKKLQDLSLQYQKVCADIGDAEYKKFIWQSRSEEKCREAKILDGQASELHVQLKAIDENKTAAS